MSIVLIMLSNHLIFCRPLLLYIAVNYLKLVLENQGEMILILRVYKFINHEHMIMGFQEQAQFKNRNVMRNDVSIMVV